MPGVGQRLEALGWGEQGHASRPCSGLGPGVAGGAPLMDRVTKLCSCN